MSIIVGYKMSSKKKTYHNPLSTKQEKVARSFLEPNKSLFVWAIRSDKIDWEHSKFGFNEIVLDTFSKIIKPKLDSYCSMKWTEVDQKESCHPFDVVKIDKELRDRLLELHPQNTPETLYQIKLDSTHRIWGYREGSIFYLLFNDPLHEGYKVKKKHT